MRINFKPWHWILIVIVLFIAIISLFFIFQNKPVNKPAENNIPTDNPPTTNIPPNEQTTTNPEPTKSTTPQNTKPTSPASISYQDALIKYADRRIQLDDACQAHPSNVTYKDNTGIMIDNRSAKTRTVKIGTTFTIKPYGFKIVVLPDTYLKSKTILVDCDQFQNVATILIQE